MKSGYLGPAGTFSQQAALSYYKNDADLILYPSINAVFKAVESGEIDEGIVPFENSIEGTVNSAIDALIFDYNLYIKGEFVLPVSQNLLVKKGYNGEPITEIMSHPQGLAQCAKFFLNNFPDATLTETSSTAAAANFVAQTDNMGVASASPLNSARLYGLKVLRADIQDDKSNSTRFVVITKTPAPMLNERQKTSVVFETEHKPGKLYQILDILSLWDLNMTKIESRPVKHTLGNYRFFVDLKSDNSADLADALKMIERKTKFYKYLGSYKEYQPNKHQ